MNYLNIDINDMLRSSEFIGSEPVERATWLCLMGWCAAQENGGVIESARDWSDRKWQQLCGITKEEATTACDLYRFDGEDLVVSLYPVDKETEVKTKRETARDNGKKGGRPRKKTEPKPTTETKEKPTLVFEEKPNKNPDLTQTESVKERKGKEWNGMEERENAQAQELSPSHVSDSAPPPFSANERQKLTAEVNSLHPHWRGEILGREECADFDAALPEVRELEELEWRALKSFFDAERKKPPGKAWPRSRREFLANFSEVLTKASEFAERSLSSNVNQAGGRKGVEHRLSDLENELETETTLEL